MKSLPTVVRIGLSFDPTQDFNEASLSMPENTKILYVTSKNNQSTLWVHFTYPKIDSVSNHCNFHFIICKQKNNDKTDIQGYMYTGNIEVFDETFCVFYSRSTTKA